MRIAYVCADPGVPVFGCKGASVHVQEVIRALRKCGAEVELFATNPTGRAPEDLAQVPVHPLPVPPSDDPVAREQRAIEANGALLAVLRRRGPFDLIYERYSLWSFAGMAYAKESGAPGVLEVNAPLIEEQARHRGLFDRGAAERVAQRVFEDATALVAVSAEVAAHLQRYPGAAERVHVVPNGVSPERFPEGLRSSCPASQSTFTIGFVGTLKPWHGLPLLTEAFARFSMLAPDSRLLLVGDGPERAALERDVAARGISTAVHWTGAVSPSAIPGLLASMDVAVAPYPASEQSYFSPLKLYEYMAAGRAIVASRIGQTATVIEDGVSGLLCSPGDAGALAHALTRLRADAGLRRRLGQAARDQALRHHTWAAAAGRILALARLAPAFQSRAMERSL